ncbi:hypothetical protein BGZ95_006336 [Linnemannia exigua]|uniref:F-box domain-containing protein n=1 Tax=Linnemannia exigua TaxID=604196 RepID=A0AAD4H7C4_9FUNG|nr:hypothetical protein BGZ95_006336 [Linnemannia exigua]
MSLPQLIDTLDALAIPIPLNLSSGASALEGLPLECIQTILGNLSDDCHALYALLLVNKAWFHMVLPFLYKSPMTLIDSTWPKLSSYSQVLKKEPLASASASPGYLDRPSSPMTAPQGYFDEPQPELSLSDITSQEVGEAGGHGAIGGAADSSTHDANSRHGRSLYSNRRTSTTSSNGGGYGSGFGYAPRTHSRSSSHSSTRSMTGDAFLQGRKDAVVQKEQRDRLVKRKKLQVLWVFLNCTLSEEERLAWTSSLQEGEEVEQDRNSDNSNNNVHSTVIKESTLLSLDLNPDLDINLEYFQPMVDYLSFYTHQAHPGLRFITWKLFPTIDDAFTIEWRLISHGPERIRELFLESVQLQDMIPLVSRLEALHKIKTCHESWNIPGSIEFMKIHNEHFGTVRMLELEAYLPENHDTVMSDDFGQLIGQVDHLKVLELSGFEKLQAVLEDIPRGDLKVLRLNCGSLNPQDPLSITPFTATDLSSTNGSTEDGVTNGRMTISTFLSQCRQLEELLLKPVDEGMLEWAVQERRDFQAGVPLTPTSPSSASFARPPQALVPLRIIELSGTDSEHVAMMISQAAEAFQDTLEVIKANSHSYIANRTQKMLSWRFPMPKLRVLKIVGRSNLPFDFRSLQYCPELRILDLSKYSGMRGCQEAGLLNLTYLTKLEYLGLSSFDHLTDSTLRTILGCMPRLKHLRLAIGDTAFSTLGSGSFAYTNSGSMSASGSGVGKNTGSRAPGMFGGLGGSGSGGLSGGASSSSNNSATAGVGSGSDMPYRSPFAAISAASSASTSASASASSSTSPAPVPQLPSSLQTQQQQQQQQQSLGTFNMIVGQIQNQHSPFGHHYHHGHHHHHHHSHHHPPAPPPSLSSTPYHSYMSGATTAGSSIGSTGGAGIGGGMSSSSNSSVSGMGGGGGGGEMASSARSTSSSLMDRFHLENTYLSLEGILDAIDGLSEERDKNQLDKLSIVLGKLDFEEHYRRLELYNQQYQDLEIAVYRYAHAV